MKWQLLVLFNAVAAIFCASLLAHASARLHWRRRGTGLVVTAVFLWNLAWLLPQASSTFVYRSDRVLDGLWFANWLVSAFAAALVSRAVAALPRDLEDAARMDGLGALGIFWRVILPRLKPMLILVALLTVMASWPELLLPLYISEGQTSGGLSLLLQAFHIQVKPATGIAFAILAGASLLMTLPIVGIFLFARQRVRRDVNPKA